MSAGWQSFVFCLQGKKNNEYPCQICDNHLYFVCRIRRITNIRVSCVTRLSPASSLSKLTSTWPIPPSFGLSRVPRKGWVLLKSPESWPPPAKSGPGVDPVADGSPTAVSMLPIRRPAMLPAVIMRAVNQRIVTVGKMTRRHVLGRRRKTPVWGRGQICSGKLEEFWGVPYRYFLVCEAGASTTPTYGKTSTSTGIGMVKPEPVEWNYFGFKRTNNCTWISRSH